MQKQVRVKQKQANAVSVIQITDTHIFADAGEQFDGINTRLSLQQVVEHILDNEDSFDAVLVTGDLVHDPVPAAYVALAEILTEFPVPVFCIPGNHDIPDVMHAHLNRDNISTRKHLLFDHWQICLLDSWLPDTHAGVMRREELEFLEKNLQAFRDKFTLVALHHPPVSVNSPWMDSMGLGNREALLSIIEQYNNCRAVIWGHIHQEFDSTHGGARLLATPSTCVQFKPGVTQYIQDAIAKGYRKLKLLESGQFQTEVIRVK